MVVNGGGKIELNHAYKARCQEALKEERRMGKQPQSKKIGKEKDTAIMDFGNVWHEPIQAEKKERGIKKKTV